MTEGDADWLAVADQFQSAALGQSEWSAALKALAAATGSRSGQLIGIGTAAAVPFNLITDVDPDAVAEFDAMGGGDPALNPRVAAGVSAPVLKVLTEDDYLTAEDYRRNPLLQHLAQKWEVAYSCLTTLERQQGLVVGLSVLRTRREGPMGSAQARLFASLAPHARAAVRLQIALEGQGAALLAGALDAVALAACVCDTQGQVRALTAQAEELLRRSSGLSLSRGRLRAQDAAATRQLETAIARAAAGQRAPGPPLAQTLVLPGPGLPLVVEVIALPRAPQHAFGFGPRVLVLARDPAGPAAEREEERRRLVLRLGFGLTAAEAHIAVRIAAGRPAEAIAAERGAALSTVRTQIKALLSKLHLTRQLELAHLVGRL